MLVRWGSVTLVELIASEDAGISRNPKHKVLVSSQGGRTMGWDGGAMWSSGRSSSLGRESSKCKSHEMGVCSAWSRSTKGGRVPQRRGERASDVWATEGFGICSKQGGSPRRVLGCQRLILITLWRGGGAWGGLVGEWGSRAAS